MNFLIESYMLRPHKTAFTMDEKLSSIRVIEAASLATSVPDIPIANPTSAFLRAGASLVPSPVTATTFPLYLRAVTRQYLSSGRDRAKINKSSLISSNLSPNWMVSTLISPPFSSTYLAFMGHSHLSVLHFAHTIPPTNSLK
jgi:hypothetical protein